MNGAEWERKAGVTEGTLYNIRRGHKSKGETLLKLSRAVNVNHKWFVTGEGPQYPPHHEKTSEASTSNIKEDVLNYNRDFVGEACVMEDDVAVIDSAVGMFRSADSAMRDVPRGARIFVDTSAEPEDGDLVAVTYQGRVVARRLVQAAGERLLMPDDRKIAEPIREVDAKIHGRIIDIHYRPVRRVTE